MPESKFASAARLKSLISYVAFAFVVLLVGGWAVDALGSSRGVRQALVVGWMVLFPAGGWLVWRKGSGGLT